ncbi:hypothetical protein [Evansella cellulosilytica]|uniref:Appr-1-p processing domain protein n=1 Tax=Evansella cellulosilytica (strain ATCC 21833 / DSM 2522 / FERM P-1141 / JCM 9156 / N-4) TaxID=649639 RepID=E6TTC7_EVAC2|nr:hypothetical protein [Evansella cellulosilytica]ADU28467.1 Appr-1-p processing domain protein [Evansella cellulosilytica DSM 2522]
MNNNLDPTITTELNHFIENNMIAKVIKSLYLNESSESNLAPSPSFGNAFSNNNISAELDKRVKNVYSAQTLGEYIETLYQEKHKEDPLVLRRAGIDRAYKYKVVNNLIKPTKSKLLCFAIAFELDLEGTEKLLQKAGYTLVEENSVFDTIVCYFIRKGYYSGADIDIWLEEYDQPTIFSVA